MPSKANSKKLFLSKNKHKCLHNMTLQNREWAEKYINSHRCNKCIKCLFEKATKKELNRTDYLNTFFKVNLVNIDMIDEEISQNSERMFRCQMLQASLIHKKSKHEKVQALSPITVEPVISEEGFDEPTVKIENLFFY